MLQIKAFDITLSIAAFAALFFLLPPDNPNTAQQTSKIKSSVAMQMDMSPKR